jgi:hypothetical protein
MNPRPGSRSLECDRCRVIPESVRGKGLEIARDALGAVQGLMFYALV